MSLKYFRFIIPIKASELYEKLKQTQGASDISDALRGYEMATELLHKYIATPHETKKLMEPDYGRNLLNQMEGRYNAFYDLIDNTIAFFFKQFDENFTLGGIIIDFEFFMAKLVKKNLIRSESIKYDENGITIEMLLQFVPIVYEMMYHGGGGDGDIVKYTIDNKTNVVIKEPFWHKNEKADHFDPNDASHDAEFSGAEIWDDYVNRVSKELNVPFATIHKFLDETTDVKYEYCIQWVV